MSGRSSVSAVGGASTGDGADAGEGGGSGGDARKRKRGPAKPTATNADAEFGVSRGVDFTDVTAVLNMDLPTSLAVYKHRIGRTARAGQGGTAISLVSPDAADEALLAEMRGAYTEAQLHQFQVDMSKLATFRYRTEDALRAVTRHAVKEARLQEIKRELLHSKKLASHFEANPDDLEMLRHDRPLSTVRKQPQLAHVPAYLKPEVDGATESVAAVGSSSRRLKDQRGNKKRLYGSKKKGKDPLRSFKGKSGKKGAGRKSKR